MGGRLGPIGRLGGLGGKGRLGAVGVRRRTSAAIAEPTVRTNFYTTGDDTFTVTKTGYHDFYGYGPGGRGGTSAGAVSSDGGGGGAVYKRVYLIKNQVVTLHIGQSIGALLGQADHTLITLPSGLVLTAEHGAQGGAGYVPGGAPGTGLNGDINRTGGQGAGRTNPDGDPNTNDGVATGTLAEFGGALIGGGAGFTDRLPDLAGNGVGAVPGLGGTGGAPGGNGGGNGGGTPGAGGGDGAIVVMAPA